jgi:hypothetical protein
LGFWFLFLVQNIFVMGGHSFLFQKTKLDEIGRETWVYLLFFFSFKKVWFGLELCSGHLSSYNTKSGPESNVSNKDFNSHDFNDVLFFFRIFFLLPRNFDIINILCLYFLWINYFIFIFIKYICTNTIY